MRACRRGFHNFKVTLPRAASRSSEIKRERCIGTTLPLSPCTLQCVHKPVWLLDWRDRASLPRAIHCPLCFEHLGGTRASAGWPRCKSRGELRRERQYRERRASRWPGGVTAPPKSLIIGGELVPPAARVSPYRGLCLGRGAVPHPGAELARERFERC